MKLTAYLRNIIWASPLYFLSIVPFFLLADFYDVNINFKYVLFGAIGWWVALLLRVPVIFLLRKGRQNMESSSRITVLISGPAEEITRLSLLLIIGITTGNAYSVGIGWATIEILYGLIQIIGLGVLDRRTDDKAEEAKALMKQMGMDKTLAPSTPYWGALERLSANALHIGFGLLMVISPFLVLLAIPLHSFVNYYVVNMNKKSIRNSQLGMLVISFIIFGIGLITL